MITHTALKRSYLKITNNLLCFFLGCGASFDFGVKSRLLDSAVPGRAKKNTIFIILADYRRRQFPINALE